MPVIRFTWVPNLTSPGLNVTNIDTSATDATESCVESSPGIYDASFTSLLAGDYYVVPTSSGVGVDGVGVVFGVLNNSATYLETSLRPPGTVTLDDSAIEDIASGVVAGIQLIPGFTVSVVSPTAVSGRVEITQGDSYLEDDSRHIPFTLTGSLPPLEELCYLYVFFGGSVTAYEGIVEVISSTNYRLKFDLTGVQTAVMPTGEFNYAVEVVYVGTITEEIEDGNRWTPCRGVFAVIPQLG